MRMGDAVDPEAEVRKLQELVKRLEKQNEILRTTQQTEDEAEELPPPPAELFEEEPPLSGPASSSGSEQGRAVLEEDRWSDTDRSSLLLEDTAADAEDSWLFQSDSTPDRSGCAGAAGGRGSAFDDKDEIDGLPSRVEDESPLSWMRAELNAPTPGRRSLATRLDELRFLGRGAGPLTSHAQLMSPPAPPPEPEPAPAPALVRQVPRMRQSLGDTHQQTFTRASARRAIAAQGHMQSSSPPTERLADRMADLTDVRIIARMQEEALKAQVQAAVSTGSGSTRSRTNSGSPAAEEGLSPAVSQERGLNASEPANGLTAAMAAQGVPRRSLPNINGTGRHSPSPGQQQLSGLQAPRVIPKPSGIPRPGGSRIPAPSGAGRQASPMRATYNYTNHH